MTPWQQMLKNTKVLLLNLMISLSSKNAYNIKKTLRFQGFQPRFSIIEIKRPSLK